jgi:hypothetical protein
VKVPSQSLLPKRKEDVQSMHGVVDLKTSFQALNENDEELLAYTGIAFHRDIKSDDKVEDRFLFGVRVSKFSFSLLAPRPSRDSKSETSSVNGFSMSKE